MKKNWRKIIKGKNRRIKEGRYCVETRGGIRKKNKKNEDLRRNK